MGGVELRETMLAYVKGADERLLNVLKAVVESYQETDIVAYDIDGRPLTKKEYSAELSETEKDIANGKFVSQEALERESENW